MAKETAFEGRDGAPAGDQLIIQYLLGSLPEKEAERMDELAVADDNFFWRVRSVENDLVDQYVKGELSADKLERFRTHYLSSPLRRENVKFAQTLGRALEQSPETRRSWFAFPVVIPRWAFAASAALALLVLSYLAYDDLRAREQLRQVRPVAGPVPTQATPAPERPAPAVVASFVLAPPVRGGERGSEILIPNGTGLVSFDLQLEAEDFPAYQAALRDLSSGGALWRSGDLIPHPSGARSAVSFQVPANLFAAKTYVIELSSAARPAEPVANYAFKVVAP